MRCFLLDAPSCCRLFRIEVSGDIRINSRRPSQLTRIEASASLLKPCRPKTDVQRKNNKISTKTRLERSYFIFDINYGRLALHSFNDRLDWMNVNHQNIIFFFGLILSANPFERFPSGLWLQCVDARDGNALGMKRASWLVLVRWADAVSAQEETDAILDPQGILFSLQNTFKQGSNVADHKSQFQKQKTTLHYVVGDQEKGNGVQALGALVLHISNTVYVVYSSHETPDFYFACYIVYSKYKRRYVLR